MPLVLGAGMGAADEQAFSLLSLSLEQYAGCLGALLGVSPPARPDLALDLSHGARVWAPLPADAASILRGQHAALLPLLSELPGSAVRANASGGQAVAAAPGSLAHELLQMPPEKRQPHVEAIVMEGVREVSGADASEFDANTPLMESGIDSLAASEFSTRLRDETGVELSATDVFDHPTPRAIAWHVVERLLGAEGGAAGGDAAARVARCDTGQATVSISSLLARWPGGAGGIRQVASMLDSSGDAIRQVPAARWTLDTTASQVAALSHDQRSSASYSACIPDIESFDARAFAISPAESLAMDPQQRLLLELGYSALHGTGQRRAALVGAGTGFYLGIERPDWSLRNALKPDAAAVSVYTITGDTISIACGRLSFALGLQGPCVSLDTACSSGHVVVHTAAAAVRAGECPSALVSSVSLKLMPHTMLAVASAGMLAADGRCKTFDRRANGYTRSEGCASLVVQARPPQRPPLRPPRTHNAGSPSGIPYARRPLALCATRHPPPPPSTCSPAARLQVRAWKARPCDRTAAAPASRRPTASPSESSSPPLSRRRTCRTASAASRRMARGQRSATRPRRAHSPQRSGHVA